MWSHCREQASNTGPLFDTFHHFWGSLCGANCREQASNTGPIFDTFQYFWGSLCGANCREQASNTSPPLSLTGQVQCHSGSPHPPNHRKICRKLSLIKLFINLLILELFSSGVWGSTCLGHTRSLPGVTLWSQLSRTGL